MSKLQLGNIRVVYFLGIGGIGMSALARFLLDLDIEVFGYDMTQTELTNQLSKEGATIHYTDNKDLIPRNFDLVIYTPAVPQGMKEYIFLSGSGKPMMKRAAFLGLVSRSYRTIGIAGTHGKTTTCTMLAYLLHETGVGCTAFLGGISHNFKTNYIKGQNDIMVVEADEYDRSFLSLEPEMLSILSMDADHLDIYGEKEGVRASYLQFLKKIRNGGTAIINSQYIDSEVLNIVEEHQVDLVDFSSKKSTVQYTNIRYQRGSVLFDFTNGIIELNDLQLRLPGEHNISNACVAIELALRLGANGENILNVLPKFSGVERRFDVEYEDDRVVFINDYAHHPTELEATIQATKAFYPDKEICGIFQPHLFSRTRDFLAEFEKVLSTLDILLLFDIYPAREKPIEGVNSSILLSNIELKDKYLVTNENLILKLKEIDPEVILMMGAGNINLQVQPVRDLLIQNAKEGTRPVHEL